MVAAAAAFSPALRRLPSAPPSPPPPPPPSRLTAAAPEAPAPTPTPPQQPPAPPRKGYFPKHGETLELTCETLAFKGKGVCKVTGSTFVLLCDGALPGGERLLARVRRLRRGAFAEASKLRTLEPHHDAVEAPCPLAADCGGCKTQSLAYAAQIHKYLQVRDLLVNFSKFNPKNLETSGHDSILKPIVPCDEIFRCRNNRIRWSSLLGQRGGCKGSGRRSRKRRW